MAYTATLERTALASPTTVHVVTMPVPDITAARVMPWQLSEMRIAQQPKWLRLYRTARPALAATLWNRASVSLFHFESNCLQYNLPPQKGESDEAKFARWCLGANRGVTRPAISTSSLPTITDRIGIHDDDPREVAEILRINSAPLVVDPLVSNDYFYDRAPLFEKIAAGTVTIYGGALGWGMYLDTRKLHAGPGYAMQDGTPIIGDHLPREGEYAMGRNRPFWRPGAQHLADDVG